MYQEQQCLFCAASFCCSRPYTCFPNDATHLITAVPKTTIKSRRLSVSYEICSPHVATTLQRPKNELQGEDKRKQANLTAYKLVKTIVFLKAPTNKLLKKEAGQFLTDNAGVSLAILRVSLWWHSAYCNCATLQVQEELTTYMKSLNNYGYLLSGN